MLKNLLIDLRLVPLQSQVQTTNECCGNLNQSAATGDYNAHYKCPLFSTTANSCLQCCLLASYSNILQYELLHHEKNYVKVMHKVQFLPRNLEVPLLYKVIHLEHLL